MSNGAMWRGGSMPNLYNFSCRYLSTELPYCFVEDDIAVCFNSLDFGGADVSIAVTISGVTKTVTKKMEILSGSWYAPHRFHLRHLVKALTADIFFGATTGGVPITITITTTNTLGTFTDTWTGRVMRGRTVAGHYHGAQTVGYGQFFTPWRQPFDPAGDDPFTDLYWGEATLNLCGEPLKLPHWAAAYEHYYQETWAGWVMDPMNTERTQWFIYSPFTGDPMGGTDGEQGWLLTGGDIEVGDYHNLGQTFQSVADPDVVVHMGIFKVKYECASVHGYHEDGTEFGGYIQFAYWDSSLGAVFYAVSDYERPADPSDPNQPSFCIATVPTAALNSEEYDDIEIYGITAWSGDYNDWDGMPDAIYATGNTYRLQVENCSCNCVYTEPFGVSCAECSTLTLRQYLSCDEGRTDSVVGVAYVNTDGGRQYINGIVTGHSSEAEREDTPYEMNNYVFPDTETITRRETVRVLFPDVPRGMYLSDIIYSPFIEVGGKRARLVESDFTSELRSETADYLLTFVIEPLEF